MTIEELQSELAKLPRYPGGSSWIILSAAGEESTLWVAPSEDAEPDCPDLELHFTSAAELELLIQQARVIPHTGKCVQCGCTDKDCSGCVQRTGRSCHWIAPNLCSACVPPSDH